MQRYVPHHLLPLSSCVSPRGEVSRENTNIQSTCNNNARARVLAQRRAVAALRLGFTFRPPRPRRPGAADGAARLPPAGAVRRAAGQTQGATADARTTDTQTADRWPAFNFRT